LQIARDNLFLNARQDLKNALGEPRFELFDFQLKAFLMRTASPLPGETELRN